MVVVGAGALMVGVTEGVVEVGAIGVGAMLGVALRLGLSVTDGLVVALAVTVVLGVLAGVAGPQAASDRTAAITVKVPMWRFVTAFNWLPSDLAMESSSMLRGLTDDQDTHLVEIVKILRTVRDRHQGSPR
ncbi:hypothetical protein ACGFYE_38420 [Streptomyces zaomyceticus]|uniref:hypothetical protein n=1 Tax=Streptomyces zaomyceticus TaxID=68286 RepID=UPI003720EA9C